MERLFFSGAGAIVLIGLMSGLFSHKSAVTPLSHSHTTATSSSSTYAPSHATTTHSGGSSGSSAPKTAPAQTAGTAPAISGTSYPLHTNITATVFWVGEPVGNGSSEDNSVSAYDDSWEAHYGGFDNPTYLRNATNNFFPTGLTPKENPFYLDLPFDDINNRTAHNERLSVIPWAKGTTDPGYTVSLMKNSWVKITRGGGVCYGQVEDAGPYVYDDANYVFGTTDPRPKSLEATNAGMDVSPALRDCLGFNGLNNDENKVSWQFVDAANVPDGPWKKIVTTSQVYQP